MNDGTEYAGELLSVRDSVMILCRKYNASEKDLSDSVYAIYSLNNRDIKLIELQGGNYAIYGIIFGGLTGSIIGAAIGKTNETKSQPLGCLQEAF